MRIRELAAVRVTYGYRRLHVLLQREGWRVNHKRVYRMYRQEGLTMRPRKPRRNVSARNRIEKMEATRPNETWSMDFMSDELFDGRRIRLLTLVDNFTRESLAIEVGQSIVGRVVVEVLARVGTERALPQAIRVDNGPEFTSRMLDQWAYLNGVELDFSRPGKPTDNAFIEWTNERDASPAFNSGFSFSSLTVSDNLFLSGDVASFFSYIVVKPYGAGHFLNGVTISNNKFRSINGSIERADRVDDSFAELDFDRTKNLNYHGNTYHNVSVQPSNPLRLRHSEVTAAKTWVVDAGGLLPFSGWTLGVDSVLPIGSIKSSGGQDRFAAPFVRVKQGGGNDKIDVVWEEAVTGEVALIVRMDD